MGVEIASQFTILFIFKLISDLAISFINTANNISLEIGLIVVRS